MKKIIFILSFFFQISILAQNALSFDSIKVKEILSTSMGIILNTDCRYIHLLYLDSKKNNTIEETQYSKVKNFIPRGKFHLVKFHSIPLSTEEFNKVTFQQFHRLSLFIKEDDNGSLTLTSSAEAIIDLLIYNDYSTSNTVYFSMYD